MLHTRKAGVQPDGPQLRELNMRNDNDEPALGDSPAVGRDESPSSAAQLQSQSRSHTRQSRSHTRRATLLEIVNSLCSDDDGYEDVQAIMKGHRSCPRYALLTTNGTDSYSVTLHPSLDDCCEQLVIAMNRDVPHRHCDATDLDTGQIHYFRLAATVADD